jgi:hypothetical protein
MSFAAIGIGLFVLFAVAFNGGLGSSLVTCSACASAASLISAGVVMLRSEGHKAVVPLLAVAALAYLPVIYQRFTWSWGIDWGGLVFDALLVAFVLYALRARRAAGG